MKLAEFDALTRQRLSPLLEAAHGFRLEHGCYSRELAIGIRHLILVDIDARTKMTFRVIVGINAQPLSRGRPPSEEGAFAVQYLTPGSLGRTPKNFVCFDAAAATRSLDEVREACVKFALPCLDAIDSFGRAAEAVEEQYPAVKGQLFLLAGRRDEARAYLQRHVEYLRKLTPDAELTKNLAETEKLLAQC